MGFSNLFLNTCLVSFCFIKKKKKAILIFPTTLAPALFSPDSILTLYYNFK